MSTYGNVWEILFYTIKHKELPTCSGNHVSQHGHKDTTMVHEKEEIKYLGTS